MRCDAVKTLFLPFFSDFSYMATASTSEQHHHEHAEQQMDEDREQIHYCRIAFMGACRVGKTSILNQLVYSTFNQKYTPTLETDMDYFTQHNQQQWKLLLVDTFGGNDFPAMRRLAITRCCSFLVVFSLDEPKTYEEARRTIEEIRRVKCEGVGTSAVVNVLLVGNKRDLSEGSRELTADIYGYCESLLDESGINCMYIKVSACDRDDIVNMLNMLLHMIAPATSKFQNVSQLRRSGGSENDNVATFRYNESYSRELSELVKTDRSPSLFSLDNFCNDDDMNNINYLQGRERKRKSMFKRAKRCACTHRKKWTIT